MQQNKKLKQIANGDCHKFDERVEHITSACSILAKEKYIKRHDKVCAQQHVKICSEIEIKLDDERWYEHAPELANTSRECKVTML
jgi:hypothetical protein